MKVLSIINLKGGVGKTVSAVNIAYNLAARGKRVLLIDNDKQGNSSKFYGVHSYERPSIADVLTVKNFAISAATREAGHGNLHILPANMNLLTANKQILMDCARPQQTRLAKALTECENDYDYVIIDNAPDLNMSVVNALVACDIALIPIKIDKFAFDGVQQILEQVDEVREFNPGIRAAGFVTMYAQNNVNTQGTEWLKRNAGLHMLDTSIRKTVKVDEMTFAGIPLSLYSKASTAARDYEALTDEIAKM